jgi:hypothetical protein
MKGMMVLNKKQRRRSGRITPTLTNDHDKKFIMNESLEAQEQLANGDDFRGGVRGSDDRTKLRNESMILAEFFQIKKLNGRM